MAVDAAAPRRRAWVEHGDIEAAIVEPKRERRLVEQRRRDMTEELPGQEQGLEPCAATPDGAHDEIVSAHTVKRMLNVASSQPAGRQAEVAVVGAPDGTSLKLRRERSGTHPRSLLQRA